MKNIRNFCIIAHIDHGKSTLSDRLIETTNAIEKRKMSNQMLDSLDVEREKGITVKSAAISLCYREADKKYIFNLIDTPGHVDFSYEVNRSLAACEGTLLIVDASQGIEAQTIANFYLALEANLTIIPIINKIDLPAADPEKVANQIEQELGLDKKDIVFISAKNNIGIPDVIKQIIDKVPAPQAANDKTLKALIFDSFFDIYRGVILCVRVFEGTLAINDEVKLHFSSISREVEEVGYLGLTREKKSILQSGEVGYLILGIKNSKVVKVGDTILHKDDTTTIPLPGYREVKSMVFAGIYPIDSDEYKNLQDAIEKLCLNDGAFQYEKDSSLALGFGFRCGFLGVLHMEIIQERLSREFNIEIILTAPSVRYKVSEVKNNDTQEIIVDNPSKLPSASRIVAVEEPFVKATIISPADYLGNILSLIRDKRGIQKDMRYLDEKKFEGTFEMPLGEIVFDFYDKLKSATKGYASFDYEIIDYRPSQIVKVDILVNKESVDALSFLVHTDKARERSKVILEKLLTEIPRHMFSIPLQASIGSTIIARETIAAMRKDVTAKCYGGDISRKRKLLEKQKKGKSKMKSVGNVNIPQKIFINVLKS